MHYLTEKQKAANCCTELYSHMAPSKSADKGFARACSTELTTTLRLIVAASYSMS